MIFSLGELQFEFNKNAFNELSFSQKGAWQTGDLIGGAPFIFKLAGQKQTTELSFDCVLLMQNSQTLDKLIDMTNSHQSFELIDAEGKIWGKWAINSLQYKLGKFSPSGLPRTQEISLSLIKDEYNPN